LGLGVIGGALPAAAGSDDGNVQVRVLATVVDPDTDATVTAGDLAIAGANADVSTEVIPALTLSYYLNQHLALELFCCFAKHEIDGKGTIANLGEIRRYLYLPAGRDRAIPLHRDGQVRALCRRRRAVHQLLRHRYRRQRARRDKGSTRPGA
jgi:hypothetical protein